MNAGSELGGVGQKAAIDHGQEILESDIRIRRVSKLHTAQIILDVRHGSAGWAEWMETVVETPVA
jgi:hypothetical protein